MPISDHSTIVRRFQALDVAIDLIRVLRGPLEKIRLRDKELEDQLRRSASSIALNLAEGRRRLGRDRMHHFRMASGSAEEARTALRVAEAWGHLGEADIEPADELLDRILAMTWRMTAR